MRHADLDEAIMTPRAQGIVDALGCLAAALSAFAALVVVLAIQWVSIGAFFAIGVALVARALGVL